MIFVILGTQKFQLNRLLKEMDALINSGKVTETVFAQIGHSDYKPINYDYIDFLDKDAFDSMIKKSDLVVTHSGVGSIITAIQSEKPVIVYPRLSKYSEHVDNHQLEIAQTFEKKNYVLCCNENDDLGDLIQAARGHQFNHYVSSTNNIINLVKDFLKQM